MAWSPVGSRVKNPSWGRVIRCIGKLVHTAKAVARGGLFAPGIISRRITQMKNKIRILVVLACLSIWAMPAFAYVSNTGDPEIDEYRDKQTYDSLSQKMTDLKNKLEDLGSYSLAIEKCGEPKLAWPITKEIIADQGYWYSCSSAILAIQAKLKEVDDLKVKMSRYGILDAINKTCVEPKAIYPTLNLFKSRAYMTNKDWTMETAKGDIYIRCANDKFQIEQKKVDIRFGDIEYIQSEAKKYNLTGTISDICTNTEKFIGMSKDELKVYENRFEIDSWVDCVGPKMNKLVNEAREKVGQLESDKIQSQAAEAIEKAKATIKETQVKIQTTQQPAKVSEPIQNKVEVESKTESFEDNKTKLDEVETNEQLTQQTEVQTESVKQSGIRQAISNFINRIFKIKLW